MAAPKDTDLIYDKPETNMTKAVSLSLGFILLLAAVATSPAQTNATDMAVNRAVFKPVRVVR